MMRMVRMVGTCLHTLLDLLDLLREKRISDFGYLVHIRDLKILLANDDKI